MAFLTNVWLQTAKRAAHGTANHAAKSSGHSSPVLHWLINLGGVGVFGVGIVDSSVIPLPLPGSTDLLVLLLAAHRGTSGGSAAWLAFCAFAGSMVGGYLTWSVGHKGGEVALERYVPKRLLAPVSRWVQRYGAWAVAVSAILPPPIPLTPFLLAAGALKVPQGRYLLFYGVARALRYSLFAWLGLTFGRQFVHAWERELNGWSTPILWTYAGLVVLGIGYGFWKYRKGKRERRATGVPAQDTA